MGYVVSESKVKIIAAAIETFSRYGVRRTSMGDVAKAAGVSRQTLYANFDGKDALLAAAMAAVIEQIMQDLAADWQACDDAGAVLDVYFQRAVIAPFEAMQRMPDLKELITGVGPQTRQVTLDAESAKSAQLAAQLVPFGQGLAAKGLTPLDVAHLVVRAANDFKLSAHETDELRNLLRTLRAAVMALLE